MFLFGLSWLSVLAKKNYQSFAHKGTTSWLSNLECSQESAENLHSTSSPWFPFHGMTQYSQATIVDYSHHRSCASSSNTFLDNVRTRKIRQADSSIAGNVLYWIYFCFRKQMNRWINSKLPKNCLGTSFARRWQFFKWCFKCLHVYHSLPLLRWSDSESRFYQVMTVSQTPRSALLTSKQLSVQKKKNKSCSLLIELI